MSWVSALFSGGVDKIVDSVADGMDNLFTSDEERLVLKNALQKSMNDFKIQLEAENTKQMVEQRKVLLAEMNGENWLMRNWRPIAMLSFTFMLFNNYVLVPYGIAYGLGIPLVEIPDGVFTLLSLGMGGYMASLGAMKVVESSKWGK